MITTYNFIMNYDVPLMELHNDAEAYEFMTDNLALACWESFYDRLEYLQEICEYANIRPPSIEP